MKLKQLKYQIISFVCCYFFAIAVSFGQLPVVKIISDKAGILIGEQFQVTLETSFAANAFTTDGFVLPDSLDHFEIIKKDKLDTVYNGNQQTGLMQQFTLTSFDSGKWNLPSFKIVFKSAASPQPVYTDSISMTVSFARQDTLNQLRDIKPIKDVSDERQRWLFGAIAVTIIIILMLIGIWYYKFRRKIKVGEMVNTSVSAYEESLQSLENLKVHNLNIYPEIVVYHSQLKNIVRRYLLRKYQLSFTNSTTADLLIFLKSKNLNEPTFMAAANSLRCVDAVQFAKFQPAEPDSISNMLAVKALIDQLEKNK